MALSTISSWNYFSGANSVVRLGSTIIGEAVAIRYNLIQNRTPLYGYNAPLFNAVADGQIIVQGIIAINYVFHEYLLAAIKSQVDPKIEELFKVPNATNLTEDEQLALTNQSVDALVLSQDPTTVIRALKKKFWGSETRSVSSDYNTNIQDPSVFGRPDQHSKSIDITVELGDQATMNSTKHILKDVFFLGRNLEIAITDDPLVESYDFICRRII